MSCTELKPSQSHQGSRPVAMAQGTVVMLFERAPTPAHNAAAGADARQTRHTNVNSSNPECPYVYR